MKYIVYNLSFYLGLFLSMLGVLNLFYVMVDHVAFIFVSYLGVFFMGMGSPLRPFVQQQKEEEFKELTQQKGD